VTGEPAYILAIIQEEMNLSKRCNLPRFLAAAAVYSQDHQLRRQTP
jgi:hypothetical protein